MPQRTVYLLTWTCKGTWLPGDERGSFEWTRGAGSFIAPNRKRQEHWASRLNAPPVFLDAPARSNVRETIQEAVHHRGWRLFAMNVRTNHVHVVVEAPVEPEEAMRVLKARATRALREAGHFDPSREIWTRHGSTRYLWDERAVSVAVDYVLNRQ